jgi:hypothetical protein
MNITLYDKPLSVIQQYTNGKWNLDYVIGGIAGHTYIDENNSYLIFSPDHITIGDDVRGVIVDTNLVWKQINIFSDPVYSYTYPGASQHYIVLQIQDDTLRIRDTFDDGYQYYYSR